MNIIIEVTTEEFKIFDKLYHKILIIFDDYKMESKVFTNLWSLKEHQRQWREGIEKIKTEKKSCIIDMIQMYENKLISIDFFSLYRVGPIIIILAHNLDRDECKKLLENNETFTPDNCYRIIPKMIINENTPRWIVDA